MNLRMTEPGPVEPERGGSMKFTYPSGSRPLEGYTIKRGIGCGGFGEVYYATSDGGKEVALKYVRRNLEIELRGVMHCLNLKHHNLVALFDVKRDDSDATWIVMEYVGGESLEDIVVAHPNGMPVDEALRWMHGIAAGTAYLHDKGIVHRDLKPGNVFNDDGTVKIGDYGLSKFISASRRSGQTESVGTVHYMAPEVANGRYGKEIDIYALGIMLYEMLTGRVPFEGESVGEVLMKHLTAEPDVRILEEPYRTIVKNALEKDPEKRTRSVRDMLAALPAATGVDELPPPLRASVVREVPEAVPVNRSSDDLATAQVVEDEEPIARAVRREWGKLVTWWNRSEFAPWQQVLILAGLGIILLSTSAAWLPFLIPAVICYAIYLVIRGVFADPRSSVQREGGVVQEIRSELASARDEVRDELFGKPVSPNAPPHVPPEVPRARKSGGRRKAKKARRLARRAWRDRASESLRGKATRQRATELAGSMLLAAAATFAVMMMVFALQWVEEAEQFAFLTLVSAVGCWAVMIPAKFWEGNSAQDEVARRFWMLAAGMALGGFAFLMQGSMFVTMPAPDDASLPVVNVLQNQFTSLSDERGAPTLPGYLAFFGLLMLIPKWWRTADPLRSSRVSLFGIGGKALVALILAEIFGFPTDIGVMSAAVMACSIQVASPWLDRSQNSMFEAQQVV